MAGYTINDLKKASSINPLDKLPIQQSGVTRQIEAGMLDNATIINSGDNTGVIREEKTFIIENNSTSLQITLGDAVGRIVSDNEFTDSPEAAKGWVITVINNSTRNHALFHGNYSETLAPGDVIHYYWNGARWTVHSLAVDRLTVTGSASFGGTISGSGFNNAINGALTDLETYNLNNAITNYNDAYINGKTTRYSLGTGLTNAPDTVGAYVVESVSSPQQLSSNYYGYQIATRLGHNVTQAKYIRIKNGANNWTPWEKIATIIASKYNVNYIVKVENNSFYCIEYFHENTKASGTYNFVIRNNTLIAPTSNLFSLSYNATSGELTFTQSYGTLNSTIIKLS